MKTLKLNIRNVQGKLSRIEMKTILGGYQPKDVGGSTVCCQRTSSISCNFYQSGTGQVEGICEENSSGQCVCKAPNSSVVSGQCGCA